MSAATPSLRLLLDRLREDWRGSPMPGFFAWWGAELTALLPPRWRALLGSKARWHLLERASGGWRLRRDGQAEPLAHWNDRLAAADLQAELAASWQGVDAEDRRLVLLLPASAVLRRTLQLPQAARGKLRQVAGYELDRQTPFSAAQVHYAVRELAQGAAPGRLAVELVVVRRDTLAPLLTRLAALGIVVDAVDLPAGAGRLGINLLPAEQRPARRHPRRRLNLALAAACVVLGGLVMGGWLHNRRAALEQMQAQVEAMHGQAQQVAGLRQQIMNDAEAANFLAKRKAERGSVLAVLLDLTQRLPSSAWLERFTLDDSGQVGFQGQSPQAARLLDQLKGSSLLDNANFQGSIQADPSSGKERFYMVAQLHHAAGQAAGGKP